MTKKISKKKLTVVIFVALVIIGLLSILLIKQNLKFQEQTRLAIESFDFLSNKSIQEVSYVECKSSSSSSSSNLDIIPTATSSQIIYEDEGDPLADVIGVNTFLEKKDSKVCFEGNKPVVFLFSTTNCPHCQWIKALFDSVVKKYSGRISAYHWQLETGDNTLTKVVEKELPYEHMAIYQRFSPEGYVPVFVFGCKYYRIGNGYEGKIDGLKKEQKEFEIIIDALLKK